MKSSKPTAKRLAPSARDEHNTKSTDLSMDALANEIAVHHRAAMKAAESAIEHARLCGEALIVAKEAVGHGHFAEWVRTHCGVSERQARNYIRVARHWPELANRHRGADLSVKGALRLLGHEPAAEAAARAAHNDRHGLPDVMPADATLYCRDDSRGWLAEITPVAHTPGYVYVAVYRDLETDGADVAYTRRGLRWQDVGRCLSLLGFAPEAETRWSAAPLPDELPWYLTAATPAAPLR